MRSLAMAFSLAVAAVSPLTAQQPAPSATDIVVTAADQLLAATLLPTRAAEIRAAGVPDTTLRRIFDLFRQHQIDPVQADGILVSTRDAAREHGPTDNFGAFVQTQLAEGKRGRELSDAIRAEHQKHGKGGHGRRADGQGDQRDDDHGKSKGRGHPGRGHRPN